MWRKLNWHSEKSCTPHRKKKKKACCYLNFLNKEQELGKQELHPVYLCERLEGSCHCPKQNDSTTMGWNYHKNVFKSIDVFIVNTAKKMNSLCDYELLIFHETDTPLCIPMPWRSQERKCLGLSATPDLRQNCLDHALVFFLGEPDAGKRLCGPKYKFKARAIRFWNGDYFDTPVFNKTKPKQCFSFKQTLEEERSAEYVVSNHFCFGFNKWRNQGRSRKLSRNLSRKSAYDLCENQKSES